MNNVGIANWLMVGITAVYVIATIVICIFNWKAVKATREQVAESKRQLEESKRQHEESKRLQLMPFLTVESKNGLISLPVTSDAKPGTRTTESGIIIKNIGLGTAHNLQYQGDLKNDNKQRELVRYLQVGETKETSMTTTYGKHAWLDDESLTIEFSFFDLLNNKYSQKISFICRCDGKSYNLTECTVDDVVLIQEGKPSNV